MIRNAWYVVAETAAVGRTLLPMKVLGEQLVIYRTEAGDPVVLDGRCAHRRFPLAQSRLVGDRIECGYHGFKYEPSGQCSWAPGLAVKPGFGVRRYPCAEKGAWLWAWMGNPDLADASDIPLPELDPADNWRTGTGYKHNPGNYMLLIENLLDLTHLHFLHGTDVSDIKQATAATRKVPMPPNGVGWVKETPHMEAALFAVLVGADPAQTVSAITYNKQYGPSLNYGIEDRFALPGEENPFYPLRFHVIHAITPEDQNNTHQFFQGCFNRDLVNGIDAFVAFARDHVFEQDATAIGLVQQAIINDQRTENVEFGIPGDRYGVGMRQILRKMKRVEQPQA